MSHLTITTVRVRVNKTKTSFISVVDSETHPDFLESDASKAFRGLSTVCERNHSKIKQYFIVFGVETQLQLKHRKKKKITSQSSGAGVKYSRVGATIFFKLFNLN